MFGFWFVFEFLTRFFWVVNTFRRCLENINGIQKLRTSDCQAWRGIAVGSVVQHKQNLRSRRPPLSFIYLMTWPSRGWVLDLPLTLLFLFFHPALALWNSPFTSVHCLGTPCPLYPSFVACYEVIWTLIVAGLKASFLGNMWKAFLLQWKKWTKQVWFIIFSFFLSIRAIDKSMEIWESNQVIGYYYYWCLLWMDYKIQLRIFQGTDIWRLK